MGFKTENGWKYTSKNDYSKSQLNFYKKTASMFLSLAEKISQGLWLNCILKFKIHHLIQNS